MVTWWHYWLGIALAIHALQVQVLACRGLGKVTDTVTRVFLRHQVV